MKMYLALIVLGLALSANPTYGKDDVDDPEPEKYVVELKIWLDKKLFDRYKKTYVRAGGNVKKAIEADIRVVIHEINQSYLKTLYNSGIDLQVRFKELNWDVTNFGFTTRGMQLVMLKKFTNYITKNTRGKSVKHYDLNILFAGSKWAYGGHVNKGSICSPPVNAAFVKFRGNQQTAKELSRMIVESITPKRSRCPSNKDYADGTSPSWHSPTRFDFSPCIIEAAKKGLNDLQMRSTRRRINCISKQHTSIPEPTNIDDLLDTGLFTTKSVCKRVALDDSSGVCPKISKLNTDAICKNIWCHTSKMGCRPGITLEGMICGKGKRCYKGKCLPQMRKCH